MEIRKEVKTYKVTYTCDECGKGEMEPLGFTFLTYPPRYPHACSHCGAEQTFNCTYPAIITE